MRSVLVLCAALAALCLAFAGSLLIGAAPIDFGAVLWSLAHPWSDAVDARIIWEVRLPRVCIGAVVGASLGYGGALMQTLLSNPLVDPYITGTSAGAGLAITLAIAGGVAAPIVPALGFAAGLVASGVVLALSLQGGRIEAKRLILAGVFVSSFLSAIVMIVLFRMQPGGAANAIIVWLAGSLSGRGWPELRWSVPYALAGVALSLFAFAGLNAMRLGERRASSLGVGVAGTQWIVVTATSLMTSAAVALSGLIGFIGLLSPHVARRLVRTDIRLLAPASGLLGATGVIAADAAARTWALPGELPIGALIAILGVPSFFVIFSRETARAGGPEAARPSFAEAMLAVRRFGRRSL